MIEATPEETIAAVHALRAAGSKEMAFIVSARERAAMTHKMNKARDIENMKDDPVWFKQHREDTKYVQWEDGMYVMLDDLMGDYEKALIEDSLRGSVYFRGVKYFNSSESLENKLGVNTIFAGYWFSDFGVKLTRAQALYIATGNVDI